MSTIRQKLIASIKRDVAALVRRDPGDRDPDVCAKIFTRLDHTEFALGWFRNTSEEMTCAEIGRRIGVIASSSLVTMDDLEDTAHMATFVRHFNSYLGDGLGVGVGWDDALKLADKTLAKAGALARYKARHAEGEQEAVAA